MRLGLMLLVGFVAVSHANADIVGNFDVLDFDTPELPGNGQFDAPATITVDTTNLYGGTSGTIVFSLTGLDVTNDSTANDSATLTFNVAAVGGNIADTGSTGSQIGIAGNGAAGLSDPSELLTFSFASGSVTLGDPGTGAAVNFIGFRNVALNGLGATETVVISGGTGADGTYVGDQSAFDSTNAFGNVSSFTVNAATPFVTTATDNFSIERFGARIEFQGASAVPEPSSLAVFALGTVIVYRRRLRRSKQPIA